jgi:uncharacterized cupin superfamily protein
VCTLAEHQPRPPFIKHYSEIKQPDNSHYSGSNELHSIGSPFGRVFGLQRLGIHHELLPPGRRTSYPHAESMEEEFVYVIEGNPDAWVDGYLHRLAPGDGVGVPAGTEICHTFINNTENRDRPLPRSRRRLGSTHHRPPAIQSRIVPRSIIQTSLAHHLHAGEV